MTTLPSKVHDELAAQIFADMHELGWDGMSLSERSAQYSAWLTDAKVGGRLKSFMPADRARVWIKDGPIKEYPRAMAGVGRYATLVPIVNHRFQEIVRRALDPAWQADLETLKVKPLRLIARRDEDEAVVTWGPPRDLKHLVWAALSASAGGDSRPWFLVLTESITHPISNADKSKYRRIAERARLRLSYVDVQ